MIHFSVHNNLAVHHWIKRMTTYIKDPHKTVFTDLTGCGKAHLVLDLMEKAYNQNFDHIVIIYPTLPWNKTYHTREWIRNDGRVFLVEPKDKLYQWIEQLLQLLADLETLFIIDDIITDDCLDKRRWWLLELALSGRHCSHYFWLLTQLYSAIPKNLWRQVKAILVWYPKERADLKIIHDENNFLTDDELIIVMGMVKESKHTCLYIRMNVLVDFFINKNDRGREKINNMTETSWTHHPGS